jgi:hypothetical protein
MMEFDTNYDPLEKWDFVNKVFTPEDVFVIDGFKRTFKYGPDNIMDCKCEKCGADQKVSFRFSIFEFFPTDTDSAAIRIRVLPNKASKADAKRAKEYVLSKIAVAPQATPTGVGGTSQREARVRSESSIDDSPQTVKQTIVKPDINQTGTMVIPRVPANLAAKILEEAKHEVELEIEGASGGQAQFKSIVGKK